MAKRTNKGITLDQVIAALKSTRGNMSLAAQKLGCERSNIQYYVRTYTTAKEAHDEAAATISDIAEGHLIAGVIKGNERQVQYWLENKARDRGYGQQVKHEHTGANGDAIKIEVIYVDTKVAE